MKLPKLSEKEFQAQVMEFAKLHGWRRAHFRCVRVQRANGSTYYETPVAGDGEGFPDMLLIHETRKLLVAAELKVKPNKPTAEQLDWLKAMASVGARTFVWYPADWPEIEKVIGG